MQKKQFFLLLLLTYVVISFFAAAKASAAEYFVATDGSDNASGSINAPFETFKPAVTKAQAGDTIYVRGGTYGFDNAMVYAVSTDYGLPATATSCSPGQKLTDSRCFEDVYTFISLSNFNGYASNQSAYTIGAGVANNPITIKNYPGEFPILDESDSRFISSFSLANHAEKRAIVVSPPSAYWVIEGLEINGASVNIAGGTSTRQVHDITIKNNDIHDITCDGGDNPGIVRIDRGDIGGPYNIFIQNNKLHGIYDWEQPGQWSGVADFQHFGAVTTLSRQIYYGAAGGGTGKIEISGNEIYNVPQSFFFKNPMAGPIEIYNNTLYDSARLGKVAAANIHFNHNLVYGITSGFWAFLDCETYCNSDPGITEINGQNAVIKFNTFVGLNSLVDTSYGTGHVITNNIFLA